MFCSSCGQELQESHISCPTCGKKAKDKAENVAEKTLPARLSFTDFKKTKEKERAQHWRPQKASKTKRKLVPNKLNEDLNELVKINIGIMLYDGQDLKIQRGKSVTLSVKKCTNARDLLNASLNKHKAHSKNMIKENANYVILYSDASKVEKLKESDEEFMLHKYKLECNKPYHRINFYICPAIDHSLASLQRCLKDDSSDNESLNDAERENEAESKPKSRKLDSNNDQPTDTTNISLNVNPERCSSSTSDNTEKLNTNFNVQTGGYQTDELRKLNCNTLSDMFPQIDDLKIQEALNNANDDIEVAVSHILGTASLQPTPEQVYASFEFCNNIENDDDFRDFNDLPSFTGNVLECQTKEKHGNDEPISKILTELGAEKLKKDSYLRVKVRRSHVWEDAKSKIKSCLPDDLNNKIKIQFVGEPAVDEGGPRNEFYSLLYKEVSASCLFTGEENRRCFNHDILALEQGNFRTYGQLCYIGIMQGSASPCFLAPVVADYIIYGAIEKANASIKDIPKAKVREKLEELQSIEDPQAFTKVASFECSFRFKAGFSKPVIQFEERDKMFRAIALHYTRLSSLSEINQFIDGLNIHGLVDCLRQHPHEARKLFVYAENQLTAELLDDLFVPVFSPRGSNKRASEEAVSLNFSRYLEEVESGNVTSDIVDLTTDEVSQIVLVLSNVLQFITGSSSVPALGFVDQPSITFQHDSERKMSANTCANTLHLPVNNTFLSYDAFKAEFTSSMVESPGFGNV